MSPNTGLKLPHLSYPIPYPTGDDPWGYFHIAPDLRLKICWAGWRETDRAFLKALLGLKRLLKHQIYCTKRSPSKRDAHILLKKILCRKNMQRKTLRSYGRTRSSMGHGGNPQGFDEFPLQKVIIIWWITFSLQSSHHLKSPSGWWFGCHQFYFPIQLGISSSQLTNSYFSEGWPWPTNQPYFAKRSLRHADFIPEISGWFPKKIAEISCGSTTIASSSPCTFSPLEKCWESLTLRNHKVARAKRPLWPLFWVHSENHQNGCVHHYTWGFSRKKTFIYTPIRRALCKFGLMNGKILLFCRVNCWTYQENSTWIIHRPTSYIAFRHLKGLVFWIVAPLNPKFSHEKRWMKSATSIPLVTTWWFIPLIVSGLVHPSYKWTLPPLIPFITKVVTHLLSGMNHQVSILLYFFISPLSLAEYEKSQLIGLRVRGKVAKMPRNVAPFRRIGDSSLHRGDWNPQKIRGPKGVSKIVTYREAP